MFIDQMHPRLLALHLETSIQRLSARLSELTIMTESPLVVNEMLIATMKRMKNLFKTKGELKESLKTVQIQLDKNDKAYSEKIFLGQRIRRS